MSNSLGQLLQDKDRAGVYLTGPDTRLVAEAAQAAGLALWRVDIGRVHDRDGFTGLVAKALDFPPDLLDALANAADRRGLEEAWGEWIASAASPL